jgi:hypothetical protein
MSSTSITSGTVTGDTYHTTSGSVSENGDIILTGTQTYVQRMATNGQSPFVIRLEGCGCGQEGTAGLDGTP